MRRRPLGLLLIPLFITTMTLADSRRRDPGDDALVAAKLLHDAGYGGLLQAQRVGDSIANFNVVETGLQQLQAALTSGEVSSGDLVALYLLRIARYEPVINAAITINPNVFADARTLDEERARGQIRGPLHGIPIAVKDNINTTNMPTTGGALAFDGIVPPYDATLITNLKGAGAIIIAKTVLTELANWVTNGMPTNYSAVGGYGFNPYDPRSIPVRLHRSMMGVRHSPQVARAAGAVRPPVSGPPTSAPRRRARSSAPRARTCSPASSRPSVA